MLSKLDLLSRLRDRLTAAAATRDGRLPAERRLAEEFGVSRARIRRVLAVVEAEDKIVRHVGNGTFLRKRSVTGDIARRTGPRVESGPSGKHVAYKGFESFNAYNVHKWLFADPAMYRVIMELRWRCVNWLEVASELSRRHLSKETPDGVPCTKAAVLCAIRHEKQRMQRLA